MREIKFRAWDKLGKEMFRVIMLSFPVGEKRIIVSGRGGSTDTENNDCILMQFTGLHDKNGKEIYEGDIIQCKCAGGLLKFEIVWEEKDARFNRKDTIYLSGGVTSGEGTEVIGNIYENPELLKEL